MCMKNNCLSTGGSLLGIFSEQVWTDDFVYMFDLEGDIPVNPLKWFKFFNILQLIFWHIHLKSS